MHIIQSPLFDFEVFIALKAGSSSYLILTCFDVFYIWQENSIFTR
jgi:hypothetical protein